MEGMSSIFRTLWYERQQIKKVSHGYSFEHILQPFGNRDHKQEYSRASMEVYSPWQRKLLMLLNLQRRILLSWMVILNAFYKIIDRCEISTKKHFAILHTFLSNQHRLNWVCSEQYLLISLVVSFFSCRPGCISTHWYICIIYPRSYDVNF